MSKSRFTLHHTQHNESIASIEMDTDLLKPEAGILDPETMTLRSIKGGSVFTVVPLDDYRIAILKRIKKAHTDFTKGNTPFYGTVLSRIDSLIEAIGLMFKPIKFVVVDDKEDLNKLINPDGVYQKKIVTYYLLEELLGDSLKDFGNTPEVDEDEESEDD